MGTDSIQPSYFQIKEFLDEIEQEAVAQTFAKVIENSNFKKPHKHITEISAEQIKEVHVFKLLCEKIERIASQKFGAVELNFINLWLVETKSSNSRPNVPPYKPHFDAERRIKGMIYLHDVKTEHGPIHLAKPINENQIEQKRKALSKKYSILGENLVTLEEIEGNFEAMVGNAGDLILFDTNSPHFAGLVKKGFVRKVIRFDFEHTSFISPKAKVKRILKKLGTGFIR